MLINLNETKKLYASYSTIKTNNSLLSSYYRLINDNKDIKDIRQLYNSLITSNYLNESVIKSAFINRYLSKKSPRLNVGVFELNTLDSRADLAFINGSSYVYEIKTEYDDFVRLESQLNDYKKLFEYLYVIVPKSDVSSVKALTDSKIGVISYYKNRLNNVAFTYERKASFNNKIEPYSQLTTLTKKELLTLNNKGNDYSFDKEDLISNLTSSLSNEEINTIYKKSIKDKYYEQWNYLHKHLDNIYDLDYQWFFKNNIDYKIIYR